MAQRSSARRRALIVEDEYVFAMGLAADMQALGFDCDLVANGQDAFLQAMEMSMSASGGKADIPDTPSPMSANDTKRKASANCAA